MAFVFFVGGDTIILFFLFQIRSAQHNLFVSGRAILHGLRFRVRRKIYTVIFFLGGGAFDSFFVCVGAIRQFFFSKRGAKSRGLFPLLITEGAI